MFFSIVFPSRRFNDFSVHQNVNSWMGPGATSISPKLTSLSDFGVVFRSSKTYYSQFPFQLFSLKRLFLPVDEKRLSYARISFLSTLAHLYQCRVRMDGFTLAEILSQTCALYVVLTKSESHVQYVRFVLQFCNTLCQTSLRLANSFCIFMNEN